MNSMYPEECGLFLCSVLNQINSHFKLLLVSYFRLKCLATFAELEQNRIESGAYLSKRIYDDLVAIIEFRYK